MSKLVWPGHTDPEFRRRFEEGRARAQRWLSTGSRPDLFCGAKKNGGGFCRQPKVRGFNRCRHHIGGADAQRFRELKQKRFEQGRLSPDQMRKYEARQARNRLNAAWRRNPWIEGATINLDEFEAEFRETVARAGFLADELPPGLADKARWKWRRFRLDGEQPDKWHAFLSTDLPRRVIEAGPRPALVGTRLPGIEVEPVRVTSTGPWSRRRRPDRSRSLKKAEDPVSRGEIHAIDPEVPPSAAILVATNRELRDALACCDNAVAERRVIAAFAALAAAPRNIDAPRAWHGALSSLRV